MRMRTVCGPAAISVRLPIPGKGCRYQPWKRTAASIAMSCFVPSQDPGS
jgi:hypothetical protein